MVEFKITQLRRILIMENVKKVLYSAVQPTNNLYRRNFQLETVARRLRLFFCHSKYARNNGQAKSRRVEAENAFPARSVYSLRNRPRKMRFIPSIARFRSRRALLGTEYLHIRR